jgi:hypothetical protein
VVPHILLLHGSSLLVSRHNGRGQDVSDATGLRACIAGRCYAFPQIEPNTNN